ncbi:MAG: hypothetical protein CM1200mP3_05330 [Chloroflexota bacterium]|nr:MAG: hypothetical protein CM1200mP3_05330 [Chloroflexota bacterium]
MKHAPSGCNYNKGGQKWVKIIRRYGGNSKSNKKHENLVVKQVEKVGAQDTLSIAMMLINPPRIWKMLIVSFLLMALQFIPVHIKMDLIMLNRVTLINPWTSLKYTFCRRLWIVMSDFRKIARDAFDECRFWGGIEVGIFDHDSVFSEVENSSFHRIFISPVVG